MYSRPTLAISDLQGPPVNRKYLGSGWEYTHRKIAPGSSLNELSTDALTLQIGSAESPLASFLFVLSLGGRGYVTVLRTDALQAPLDRARGELSSDTRTLIFHLKIIRGKIGEIWRSEIATYTMTSKQLSNLMIIIELY